MLGPLERLRCRAMKIDEYNLTINSFHLRSITPIVLTKLRAQPGGELWSVSLSQSRAFTTS